ncbi:MAG TPA: glycosyltransferase family 39 protein [Candidatus Dormibacteraeota bacterium]|nr:glycosyltransferase family 39 protein [Candidatus Dormibacteraeota bacterium]
MTTAAAAGRPSRHVATFRLLRSFRQRTRWTEPAFVVYGLLRVPSFLEPHWYTDEGGAAAAAKALLQGRVLYSQIWSNKPPLHLWTVAVNMLLFRGSEAGLHVFTLISGALTLAAVAYAGRPLLGRGRTIAALLVVAVLLGSPLFDAELAVPESFLIAPAAWAGALVLRRASGVPGGPARWWPVVAGLLAATAIAYQQTAVADAAAFLLILVLSPRVSAREALLFAATAAAATAAWLIPALVTAGPAAVAYALVGFYVPYSQSVLPASQSGLLHLAAGIVGSVGLICVGAILTRRSTSFLWAAWVWAGADLLVAAAAQMPFSHFLVVAVASATLAFFSIRLPVLHGVPVLARLGACAVIAGVLGAGSIARVAGVDWVPQWATAGTVSEPRDLLTYYGGALQVMTRQRTLADLQDSFDDRVGGDRATAAWIKGHGLSKHTAVAWSSDAWLYVMADLDVALPTPPIYNDEVLLGNQGQVAQAVRDIDPEMIITSDDALTNFPEVQPLLASNYRAVDREQWNTVWLRNDAPLPAPSS